MSAGTGSMARESPRPRGRASAVMTTAAGGRRRRLRLRLTTLRRQAALDRPRAPRRPQSTAEVHRLRAGDGQRGAVPADGVLGLRGARLRRFNASAAELREADAG